MTDSKVVPVEPTEEMEDAFWNTWNDCDQMHFGSSYKAMITAAPTPEQEGMKTGALPDWTKHNHPAQLAIREQARRAEAAEANAKLSHDMFVGAMADIKSMEREIEAAEAKLEAVRGLVEKWRAAKIHIQSIEGFTIVQDALRVKDCADELEALLNKEQTK